MPILSRVEWDQYLERHSQAHLLQTSAWGDLKAAFGWEVVRIANQDCGAQVLFRRLPGGLRIAYIPKGPVGMLWQSLWPDIDRLCRQKRSIFLKVEPDVWEPIGDYERSMLQGFCPDGDPVQPRRTLLVNLNGREEDWQARMSKKTRACFRAAQQGRVIVRISSDVEGFYSLLEETGRRDEFGIHNLAYYRKAYALFASLDEVCLLLAEKEGHLLAGLMVFMHGKRAWYLYAASRNEQRQLNPTYLLQLEALRWAAGKGCLEYDLYGVPDFEEEILETQFTQRQDGLWGVYGFKRKFGGKLARSIGAWDRIYIRPLFWLYQVWLSRQSSSQV